MICPSCKGTGKTMAFVDGYDQKTRKRWGDYREFPCFTCQGSGQVDDRYPERRARGAEVRKRRLARNETLGDVARRLGVSVARYSEWERGHLDTLGSPELDQEAMR